MTALSRTSLWIIAALVAIGAIAVARGVSGAEAGGWIIALGTPLSSETACQLDLASLANVVPSRTRLRCVRVDVPR